MVSFDLRHARQDVFRDLADSWRNLESKAQGTVAISGIFLAAIFAFAREVDANTSELQKLSLIVATVFLAISVLSSVLSLRVRKVPMPPFDKGVEEELELIMRIQDNDELRERSLRFDARQARNWREANLELAIALEAKADLLWTSQFLLGIAVLAVATITIFHVLMT